MGDTSDRVGTLVSLDAGAPPSYTAQPVTLVDTGGYWVRWQYEAAEWQQFDALEWGAARRAWWLALGLGLLILGVGAAGSMLFLSHYFMIGAGLAGALAALGIGLSWLDYARSRRLHQARQRGPREIALGPERVRVAGLEFPLSDSAYILKRVTLVPGAPAQLVFRSAMRPRVGGSAARVLRVPVPLAQHKEAAALVRQFQQHIARTS